MQFELWKTPAGRCPVEEFILKQPPQVQRDIYDKLFYLEAYTFTAMKEKLYVKKLADIQHHKLWEIRFSVQRVKYRIPCIFKNNEAILFLVHAFVKKEQKTRTKEINKAIARARLILNI